MNADPASIGAYSIKRFRLRIAAIQFCAVAQSKNIGIYLIPQFMADRRAQILYKKCIPFFTVSAPAPAFRNGKFHFRHYFPLSAAMIRFMASMPTLMAPEVSSVIFIKRPAFSRS